MNIPTAKIILISFILACCWTSTHTFAEERFIEQDAEGFCTSLRLVDKLTLTQHMRERRGKLQQEHKVLAEHVAKMQFNAVDAVITIVMPGGLLYAAVKRRNQWQTRQNLTQLNEDIQQLTGDLYAIGSDSGSLQLAALR